MSAPPLRPGAFTLVELLVSMAILTLLVLILLSITDATRKTWTYTNSKIEQFRDAREAFETITRRLSQATLNTYWDYDNPADPKNYVRQSELRFLSGPDLVPESPTHAVFFQAPLGESEAYSEMKNLLNTCGYFIEFGSDKESRPSFVNSPERYRFRLMEMIEPSESLTLYKHTNGKPDYTGTDWFTVPLANPAYKRPVAENILGLILLPKLATGDKNSAGTPFQASDLAPHYTYDSTEKNADSALNPKNQLPPVVRVTMIAVDEASYNRLQASDTSAPDIVGRYFHDATKFDDDIKSLETELVRKKLNYRIFTTEVPIKAAKWSRSQSDKQAN